MLWCLLAVAGMAGTVGAQLWTKHADADLDRRRSRHLTSFNDHLVAVISTVSELLASKRDADAGEHFFRSLLREGVHLFGYNGVRLCVYRLEEREVEPSAKGEEAWFLRLIQHAGRGDKPRQDFVPDNGFGSATIMAARGDKPIRVPDPSSPPFEVDWDENAIWQSFLLVPLRGPIDHIGCLMIDTRECVTWTAEDVSIGLTIANLLTIGMSEMRKGGRDPAPELAVLFQELAELQGERLGLESSPCDDAGKEGGADDDCI